jgi:acetoin utilization deacetylase AcuC-like enzyme
MRWLRLENLLRRLTRKNRVPVWHHPAYRLPSASVQGVTRIEPRRADLVRGFLLDSGFLSTRDVRVPWRIRYRDLARVHDAELLESLHDPARLADVFAIDPADVNVDEILRTFRLACGGTLDAARWSLRHQGPSLNLLGGFHHAGPRRAAGLCPVNDIAVAVAALRQEGFTARVAVLDLDAHPPDGTAECFEADSAVWIGSLSSCDWGPLPGVDETRLPQGCQDSAYLAALDDLLGRMPPAELCFVVAGGDVLAGDRSGGMALTLEGAQRRDLRITRALRGIPSVWLPGGGYSLDAWKVLAGTGMVLTCEAVGSVPADYDSLRHAYASIANTLDLAELSGSPELTEDDVLADLGYARPERQRLLDFYTSAGIEYAFFRYGILEHLGRLGYEHFRVVVDRASPGDRLRLFATWQGCEHVIIESVVEKQQVAGEDVIFLRWLTMRDPRGQFGEHRPGLPGQEEPGLGLAQEAGQILGRAAQRLGLHGVALSPAWFHTAHAATRARMRFFDPERQGRYEALCRDLAVLDLPAASRAIAEGRVLCDGHPYTWEAGVMVRWIEPHPFDEAALENAREATHFTLLSQKR